MAFSNYVHLYTAIYFLVFFEIANTSTHLKNLL